MILIHPSIDPVIVSFGTLQIGWYGLAYVLSFLIGIYFIKKINQHHQKKIGNKKIDDFFIWAIVGVILGGRLGYILFYQTASIFTNPLNILYIWKGGMSFHGGLIGIAIAILFFSKKNSLNFFQLSDLVSSVAPIGLFIGRLANFINVELYGRVTNFPFAMIYPSVDQLPRHPSQLYEAFFEGIILFVILIYYNKKNYNNNNFGLITSLFLILYGVFRILLEFLREPDAHIGLFLNSISLGQLLCIPLIIIGVGIYIKQKNVK
jgi:phosphatidylglycerol:prolipoprotein diacylglycerol transferase